MGSFWRMLDRDVRIALRAGADAMVAVTFFVIAVVLFVFGIGPNPETLAEIGPGVIWVCALLASLLSLERLFLADYEDGGLEQLALSPLPLEAAALAKVTAHWVVTGIPLVAVAPVLGLVLALPVEAYAVLVASLLLGTPTLSLIGAVGAALTLGARRSGVLLALLILPLYIPALIFGVGAVTAALGDDPVRPYLLFLGGMLALALPLAPIAAAAGIRQALE